MIFKCECGRDFSRKEGLSYHKKFCGNYKIFIDGGYEAKIGSDGNMVYIHREVMEQKLGRKLKSGEVVHHKDENKRNNDPDNLELKANYSEHMKQHCRENPNKKFIKSNIGNKYGLKGSESPNSKLTENDVRNIRIRLRDGEKGANLAREYKVDATLISAIKKMTTWKHVII